MRASKKESERLEDTHEIHISGAEGLYDEKEILRILRQFTKRALIHPRGKPDKIVLTIERLREKPKKIKPLPIITLHCDSPDRAFKIVSEKLLEMGVTKRVIENVFNVLLSKKTMRGASLIDAKTGKRLEPDRERGVRVSRLGIEKSLEESLVKKLSKMKVHAQTVKEALTLASKVSSHPDVIAEICISDDPDYTTGYIASKKFGYLRIPNIKRHGENHGGRVFIIKEDADIKKLIEFLEKKPTIISI